MLVTMTSRSSLLDKPLGVLWSDYRAAFRAWARAHSDLQNGAADGRARESADEAARAYSEARNDLTRAMLARR